MRVVADTNFLISSIFWNGAPFKIVELALSGKVGIVVSTSILAEVRKVLSDPKESFSLSEQEIDDVISGILCYAVICDSGLRLDVVRDKKDNHILACAIASKADFILTRDKDLLVLKEYSGTRIVSPDEFSSSVKL